jgi:hypothetical protein
MSKKFDDSALGKEILENLLFLVILQLFRGFNLPKKRWSAYDYNVSYNRFLIRILQPLFNQLVNKL